MNKKYDANWSRILKRVDRQCEKCTTEAHTKVLENLKKFKRGKAK